MLWDFEKETIYRSDVILRFTEAFNYESIMSGRSSSVMVTAGGSVRQHTLPNSIKFAGEESKDKMYEPKHTKKLIRVLTVVAYVFSVSLAAIMLSVYYVFLWNPKDIPHRSMHLTTSTPATTCSHSVPVLSKNEMETEILGAPDLFIKTGSTLRLMCMLQQNTEPPTYVFWYHDDHMINHEKERGVAVHSDSATSVLIITGVQKSHSGNFSCVPSNARPASINVHVLSGELEDNPQKQVDEATSTLKMEYLKKSTPIPLLHSLLVQSQSRQETSSLPSKLSSTNNTLRKLIDA